MFDKYCRLLNPFSGFNFFLNHQLSRNSNYSLFLTQITNFIIIYVHDLSYFLIYLYNFKLLAGIVSTFIIKLNILIAIYLCFKLILPL